jgi:hypothetical protein
MAEDEQEIRPRHLSVHRLSFLLGLKGTSFGSAGEPILSAMYEGV